MIRFTLTSDTSVVRSRADCTAQRLTTSQTQGPRVVLPSSPTLAGPFVQVPNGDGTVTVTINGNDGHVTAPGQGTLWAEVGRLVYIADPNDMYTPLQVLQSTGQQDPLEFPAVCAGLS